MTDLVYGSECYKIYSQFCQEAIDNNILFQTFKCNPRYTYMLEHVSFEQGILYLYKLYSSYNQIINKIPWVKIKQNDLIGQPLIYDYRNLLSNFVQLDNYMFSPTTLRYLITGLDILSSYNDENKNINIVEIGGGYGGQCKILYDLAQLFNIEIVSYTILDLEYPNKIQKKYTTLFGLNVNCTTVTNFNSSCDLLISNYEFSEIDPDYQVMYHHLIEQSKHGFIIWNTSHPIPECIINKETFNKIPEVPQTANNYFVTF